MASAIQDTAALVRFSAEKVRHVSSNSSEIRFWVKMHCNEIIWGEGRQAAYMVHWYIDAGAIYIIGNINTSYTYNNTTWEKKGLPRWYQVYQTIGTPMVQS